jgi:CheY-like chemotaxis protein
MKTPYILLIEDTDSVREVITRQLEVLGAEVTALADGNMVKRELDKKTYDLVIADLHLPDCSGVDIARFAKAKNCKIILMSGDNNVEKRPDLLNSQFDKIISKPVTMKNFKKILTEMNLISNMDSDPIEMSFEQKYDKTGVINLSLLQEQMGDLDDLALQMVARFSELMRPLITELENALLLHDMKRAAETAHSLKGAARSAGAMQLAKICEDIQVAAESNHLEEIHTEELEIEFAKVDDALQNLSQEKSL